MDTKAKIQIYDNKEAQLEEINLPTKTFSMLKQLKFPVLIGVSSTQSSYNHVVVIWNGMVIDYESMHTYTLTEDLKVGFNTV